MRSYLKRIVVVFLGIGFAAGSVPAHAQNVETPYWASIKDEKAYARVGPAGDYKIAWVYQRKDLPVKVLKRYESWRQIEDHDGEISWVYAKLLSLKRTAVIVDGTQKMLSKPSANAPVLWRAEPGVVGVLGSCTNGYCEFDVNGQSGYVIASALWGVGKP